MLLVILRSIRPEVFGDLLEKKTPTQLFYIEFCLIFQNIFLKNNSGRLY